LLLSQNGTYHHFTLDLPQVAAVCHCGTAIGFDQELFVYGS